MTDKPITIEINGQSFRVEAYEYLTNNRFETSEGRAIVIDARPSLKLEIVPEDAREALDALHAQRWRAANA